MLQMLGHVKRRPEHHIEALDRQTAPPMWPSSASRCGARIGARGGA